MTKKVLILTTIFLFLLMNGYSQNKSSSSFKLEAIGEGTFPIGSELKQLSKTGYGLGLKGLL